MQNVSHSLNMNPGASTLEKFILISSSSFIVEDHFDSIILNFEYILCKIEKRHSCGLFQSIRIKLIF